MLKLTYKILNRVLYSGKFGDVKLRRELIQLLPKKPINYCDIGGFDGSFFLFLQKELNIKQGVIFEPQEKYFQLLKNKFEKNAAVSVYPYAVSDQPGELEFYENALPATSSLLPADEQLLGKEIDISGTKRSVEVVTLDSMNLFAGESIGLMKLDIQGAELHALTGAINTLQRTEYIWIEVSFKPLYKGSPVFEDIVSFLESQQFIMVNILPGFKSAEGELLQADVLFKKRGI